MSRNYKNGKIYCIRNTITDDIYVGSSCEKYLSKRWVKHKSSMNNDRDKDTPLYMKMNELGVENFYIELIENYPCESNDELRAREGHYIRELSTLNKRVETRTDKEWKEENRDYMKDWKKQYYQEHKEETKERVKQYRENNPELIKKQKQEYYRNHRDELIQKNKERGQVKFVCECGGKYTKQHQQEHNRSQRHQAYLNQQNEN